MEYGPTIKNSSSISSKETERALGPKSTGKSERKQKWDRDLMSIPNITESISGYTFRWDDLKLSLKISRLRIHNDGRVTGEVLITTDSQNMYPILYPQTQLNFSSSTTRQHLINILKAQYPQWDWVQIIDQVSYKIQEMVKAGEPVQELWTHDEVKPPEFLLEPILIKGLPTVIFGEKGVLKSSLSLLFCVCLILPWHDNPLGLSVPTRSIKTLYLDWEADNEVIQWTTKKLQNGLDLPSFPIYYRRCALPLADDVEQIQNHIINTGAEVVVIDSLGAAAGGEELGKSQPATSFYAALRRLNVTSLIIGQTSKDTEAKKKTIYGSTLFSYYARNIFELVKSEEDSDEIDVALFHRSFNLGGLHKPIGFRMTFNDNEIKVESKPVSVREFFNKVSTQAKLLELLKGGAMTVEEIIQELEIKRNNAHIVIHRLRERKQITKVGNKWGLSSQEEMF